MATVQERKEVKKVAVLIPAFCEENTVGEVVSRAAEFVQDVIVVDDASTDETVIRAEQAGATVLRRTENGGKGVALTEGFRYVLDRGYDAVIALDADGFHDPDYIERFLEAYHRTHIPVLIGNRMGSPEHVSPLRRLSIQMMSHWLYRLWGVYVPDPPCGFRFYRCDVLPFLLESASSFPVEFETLLHVASHRIRIDSVRIQKRLNRHKSLWSPVRDMIRFVRVLRKFQKKSRHKRGKIRIIKEEL